jgi:glucarate dehydratase
MTDDVIQGCMHQYVDGGMLLPEGPGLGVALDGEKFQHYAEMYKERANLKESDEAQYDPLNPTWQPELQIW